MVSQELDPTEQLIVWNDTWSGYSGVKGSLRVTFIAWAPGSAGSLREL